MGTISRRELIGSLLGLSAATLAGCSKTETAEIEGDLLSPDFETGHRLRDHGASIAAIREWNEVPVAIVGGGIAGLTAGWRLQRSGYSDFVLLELEDRVGGTSSSGSRESFQFPWGAHYITTPLPENIPLIEFLQEMGVVENIAPDGDPIIAEEYLCRDPEERIYAEGTWREGLFPVQGASQDDLDQVADFHERMLAWALKRDANGKRWFALPIAHCSDDPEPRSLDQISMLQWMQEQGWDSPRLRWYVDYACRDDYGLSIDRTSAWAGILYYASRLRRESRQSQDVITWPSGNGRIVEYLRDKLKSRIQSRKLVYRIQPSADSGRDARCELAVY
ncbi:MAG: FAD-dependent oxidoreductase, partial [Planctomycetota bacterium]